MMNSLLQGTTRLAFLVFFVSHIPITLLVDGQALLPRKWYPQSLIDIVDWYAVTFKDKLMTHPTEPWFTSLVSLELLLQLPFFLYAVYSLFQRKLSSCFRPMCVVYGASTATTLVPIFASILSDDTTTISEKLTLTGFYIPYLVFPLWLTIIAVNDDIAQTDIGDSKRD